MMTTSGSPNKTPLAFRVSRTTYTDAPREGEAISLPKMNLPSSQTIEFEAQKPGNGRLEDV